MTTLESETKKVSASIDGTFQQSGAMLVENRRNLLELVRNMKETSATLKLLVSDVQRNPWKLIRKGDETDAQTPENKLVSVEDKHVREGRRDRIP